MSIRVRTTNDPRTFVSDSVDAYPDADDFTVDFDSGTLTVQRTDDQGNPVAIYAVYARGGWAAVFNDDTAQDGAA